MNYFSRHKGANGCQDTALTWISLVFGYIFIGLSEPLSFVPYVLRGFRLRKIFDAQIFYYRED